MSRQNTMDFFELQLENRRHSRFYYYVFLALTFIPVAIALAYFTLVIVNSEIKSISDFIAMLIILLIIVGIILNCYSEFTKSNEIDGRQIAEKVGGVRLSRAANNSAGLGDEALPSENQADPGSLEAASCLNVMEELAIAAGLPCPAVYLMPEEAGLNVFTVGALDGESVVVVSRGLIESLDRAELQAVLAHELSHILNGDLRQNMYMASRAGHLWDTAKGARKKAAESIFLGKIFGYLFYLFWLMINAWARKAQTYYCHKREYLADATAVQLTRSPQPLYSALSKICRSGTSAILAKEADLVNFLFIADHRATPENFSIHPEISERLALIMPEGPPPGLKTAIHRWRHRIQPQMSGGRPASSQAAGPKRREGTAAYAAFGAGSSAPGLLDLARAGKLLETIPSEIKVATEYSSTSFFLAGSIFISRDEAQAANQFRIVNETVGQEAAARIKTYWRRLLKITDVDLRLPLLDLMAPALKALPPAKNTLLRKLAKSLVQADGQVELFELAAFQVLTQILTTRPQKAAPTRPQALEAAGILLSAVARTAHPKAPEEGFRAAGQMIPGGAELAYKPGLITVIDIGKALKLLAGSEFDFKVSTLQALTKACVGNGELTPTEYELIRVTAAALYLPAPL